MNPFQRQQLPLVPTDWDDYWDAEPLDHLRSMRGRVTFEPYVPPWVGPVACFVVCFLAGLFCGWLVWGRG